MASDALIASPEILAQILACLRTMPADGKLNDMWDRGNALAIFHGFIQEVTVDDQCKCCGNKRPGRSFYKISGAGRLLLLAAGDN